MKTAKALGLDVLAMLLARADVRDQTNAGSVLGREFVNTVP